MNSFRYSLVNEAGEYLYLSGSTVLSTIVPKFSYVAPFNWTDTQIVIERDIIALGLFRTYTLPASFTTEMAKLLRCMYLDKGYEAYAKLVIDKRKNYSTGFQKYAEAEVDFTKYVDIRQGQWTVSINLFDNGIAEFLKSIETTVYEIPLNDPDAIVVNMDGIELRNRAKWAITDGTNPANNPTAAHILDTTIVSVESLNQLDVKTVSWKNWATAADFYDDWLYKASTSREVTFRYDFYIDFEGIPGGSYSVNKPLLQIFKAGGSGSGSNTSVHVMLDLTAVSPAVFLNQVYHVQGTFTVTPSIGDRFYFSTRLTPTPASSNIINFNYGQDSYIELDYYDRVPAFDVKTFRFWHLFKKVIEKASNGKYTIASQALTAAAFGNSEYAEGINNIPWQTAITSGDGLRGLDSPVIKITYGQLRDFARNTWGMGVSQEADVLRIEKLEDIFDNDNVLLTINSLANFKLFSADNLLAATVEIGYEEQTYDLLNGKDEFNTRHQYKLPVRRPTQKLNMVNSIRADIYGIEYIRYNRYLKDTTDSKFDNSVFAIEIEPTPSDGKYNLLRRVGLKQGVVSPDTVYNLGLTPRSCFIRNLPYIYSILPNTQDGFITFQTTDKNRELRTSLGSPAILVDEDSDIRVDNYIFRPASPLFRPVYVEFECSPPADLAEQVAANPYSVIRFRYGSNYFKGFIVNVGVKPAKNDTYVFKLLLTTDNDMNLFKIS